MEQRRWWGSAAAAGKNPRASVRSSVSRFTAPALQLLGPVGRKVIGASGEKFTMTRNYSQPRQMQHMREATERRHE